MNYLPNLCRIKFTTMELASEKSQVKTNGDHFMPRIQNQSMMNQNTTDMIISIEKKMPQPSCTTHTGMETKAADSEKLKSLFHNVLIEKQEMERCNIDWVDNKTVVVDQLSGMALHNFLLKVEKLGKSITLTKKTVIEIH